MVVREYYEVIVGKAVGRGVSILTYASSLPLSSGMLVEVPLMRGRAPGVVYKKVVQPNFKCKEITRILYTKPLPQHLVKTAFWMAEYYVAPLSAVVQMMLPNGILKKRRTNRGKTEQALDKTEQTEQNGVRDMIQKAPAYRSNHIPLNPAQKKALEGLQKACSATKLLFGVTGSGKTNIYLTEALNALKRQKSVVLLVPEIALTSQLVKVFQDTFSTEVVLVHSQQTEAERHQIFESLLLSDRPQIVIGPRSALFAPLDNLGLIIIDEEHESTYYQENTPKYSAIRVASYMASQLKCTCLLGSATPTVEDYHLARKRDSLVILPEKAKETAVKPKVTIIDLKKRDNFSKNRYFCNDLIRAIVTNLEMGQQTLIFHNRRGSSPLTICENCGEELMCPNCFLPLTLHADVYEMQCHTCGYKRKVPSVCPSCNNPGLIHKGFGTKLLESELNRLFPEARIKRFDADNKKGETLDVEFSAIKAGEIDILVGTQVLAKGLDLPKLATVGVVQADAGLSLPDFAAEEKVFQLITQVMGRVGRGHINKAEVFIQTYQPDNPVLKFATSEDYPGFFEYLLKKRKKSGFPPFGFVAKCAVTMKTEASALKKARDAYKIITQDGRFIVSPPCPAFHERNSRGYTWELTIRGLSRKALSEVLTRLDSNFHVSLDPPSLL